MQFSKINDGLPFHEKYPNYGTKISVEELLTDCRKIVVPIARAAGVSFDMIKVVGEDVLLFLDKEAFQIVFFLIY